jgi:hypothetical protein
LPGCERGNVVDPRRRVEGDEMPDPAKTTTGEAARERVAGVDDPTDSMHHAEDAFALEHSRGFFRVWRAWLRRRIGR